MLKTGSIILFVMVLASDLFAGALTNNYAVGDVLLCFRKTAGNGNDLVVDIGQIAIYTNTTVNQRIAITNYTGTQLAQVGTNSISWSAFSWFDETVSPVGAQGTLFVSRGRTSTYSKSATYAASGASLQLFCASSMQPVPLGAKDARTFSVTTSSNAVIEPDDNVLNPNSVYQTGQSYNYAVHGNSSIADFDGSFPGGDIEIATPLTFTTAGRVARSDFYRIPPTGSGAVKYLGFFEFNTNGVMTFVAQPTLPDVTILAATPIGTTSATLNATVNPFSDNTTMFFQYGLTTAYGSSSQTNFIGTVSGTYGIAVSNLLAGTTYHYRVGAYNSVGTNFSSDLTFATTGGGAVVTPVITRSGITNGIYYVSFTTGNSGTYTLRGTNVVGLAAALTNWPAISSVAGNGLTNTLQDPLTSSNKFYEISAQ